MGARGTAPSSLPCRLSPSPVDGPDDPARASGRCELRRAVPFTRPCPLCCRLGTTVSLSFSLSARRRHGHISFVAVLPHRPVVPSTWAPSAASALSNKRPLHAPTGYGEALAGAQRGSH